MQVDAHEIHKALHVPRSVHFKVHKVLHLPRFLKTSHMSKTHNSPHLPRNHSMPKMTKICTSLYMDIKLLRSCTCHEKSTLDHQSTRFPCACHGKLSPSPKMRTAPQQERTSVEYHPAASVSHDPAQINCTWKSQNGTFLRACAANTPSSKRAHPDRTRVFTPTARTPQCGHTVWGNNNFQTIFCRTWASFSHKTPGAWFRDRPSQCACSSTRFVPRAFGEARSSAAA